MAIFDFVVNILNWIFYSIFSFFGALSTATPGALLVMCIMLFPVIVGVARVVQNWFDEREGEE